MLLAQADLGDGPPQFCPGHGDLESIEQCLFVAIVRGPIDQFGIEGYCQPCRAEERGALTRLPRRDQDPSLRRQVLVGHDGHAISPRESAEPLQARVLAITSAGEQGQELALGDPEVAQFERGEVRRRIGSAT